jgi:glucose-6-phosphate isomerase
MNLDLKIDIGRAKAAAVGAAHGLTPQDLEAIAPRVGAAHEILVRERREGVYGFYDLYKDRAVLEDVLATAKHFGEFKYDNLVVLGIGGSALGTTALVTALKPAYYNVMTRAARKQSQRIFVVDNIDPVTFRQVMRLCPPGKTLYNVISKSGATAETMAQLMIVLEALETKLGAGAVKDHVVVTTNPRGQASSLLHPVADEYGLKAFAVPLNVGGRFSVFSPVGLFPAAMAGIDIGALLEGCAAMDERCSKGDLDNPAYLRAALHYVADTAKGKTMAVMMPYADSLRDVADWYRQIWAESLGKRYDLDDREVFAGQTPIKALGVTDQHSQIQLYREGPNDKLITVIEVKNFGRTLRIPETLRAIEDLAYLRGASLNKLMAAELRGTVDALKASQRPVCVITLPRVNEHTVGQLLYMLQVETAMAGRLYHVNTFDQPGVEEGKDIARRLMGGAD